MPPLGPSVCPTAHQGPHGAYPLTGSRAPVWGAAGRAGGRCGRRRLSGHGPGPGSAGYVAGPRLRTESGSRLWGQQTADQGSSLVTPGQTLPQQPPSFSSFIHPMSTYFSYYIPDCARPGSHCEQTKPSSPHRADTLVQGTDNGQEK